MRTDAMSTNLEKKEDLTSGAYAELKDYLRRGFNDSGDGRVLRASGDLSV